MKLSEAKAVLEIHDHEVAMEKKNPAFIAIIDKMRRAGYPGTAAVILSAATLLEGEDLENMTKLLQHDWP